MASRDTSRRARVLAAGTALAVTALGSALLWGGSAAVATSYTLAKTGSSVPGAALTGVVAAGVALVGGYKTLFFLRRRRSAITE